MFFRNPDPARINEERLQTIRLAVCLHVYQLLIWKANKPRIRSRSPLTWTRSL
uniref:Uncharacterized protein n=1 Tax=Meloidogyne incognita TaxID=6306 RepID=A0A914LHX2_MELIC